MRLNMNKRRFVLSIGISCVISAAAFGQDALVILRPNSTDANACATDAAHAPRTVTIHGIKIQGKDQIRLAADLGNASGRAVTQRQFKSFRAPKIKELSEIEVRDGLMYAAAGEGQKVLAIPDVEPSKNGQMTMGQYAEMSLEADSGDKKAKQKQILPLKSIWRIFILSASLSSDEALFRHAQQEESVSQWTFYLDKVTSYRIKEAGDGLTKATTGCLDKAIARFHGGEFRAIVEAKEMSQKIVAMSGGSGPAADRLAEIRKEEQDVRDRIRDGRQLQREGKFDDALAAWEPIQKYLKDPMLKDFADAHAETLGRSHDLHLEAARSVEKNAGDRALVLEPDSEAPIRRALAEYEMALKRRPESPDARQGRREMLIRLGLMEARKSRNSKDPGKAHDVLLKLKADQGDDPRVIEENRLASCEYGTQLYGKAWSLVGRGAPAPAPSQPPSTKPGTTTRPTVPNKQGVSTKSPAPTKPVSAPATSVAVRAIQTPADKKPFVEARAGLMQALALCPTEQGALLLAKVNTALADYHVAQAKRAVLRKMHATALLHLIAAQSYQPDRLDLEESIAQERPAVEQRVRIQAGVVIRSVNNECAEAAQQIAGALESALASGGANLQLVARDQADQILRKIRSGAAGTSSENFVILSAQIGTCSISITGQPRDVQSKYQVNNQNYQNLQQTIQDYDRRVDDCKRANGVNEAQNCRGLRNERQGYKDRLSRESPMNLIPYAYQERPVAVAGQMRMTLQVDDTISKGSRNAGEAVGSLNDSCVDRQGVRDDDVAGGVVHNNPCPVPDRRMKLQEMTEQVRDQAQQRAAAAIRSVANGYSELARRATDQEVALEDYIVYVLLASDKSSTEYQQAITAIRGRDADLKLESALH
jgi:hypothetical protein